MPVSRATSIFDADILLNNTHNVISLIGKYVLWSPVVMSVLKYTCKVINFTIIILLNFSNINCCTAQ